MAIKPMLFNAEMVQAILEGRKTVTRRAVKFKAGWNPKFTGYIPDGAVLYGSNNIPAAKAPYKLGDILWVRETWSPVNVRPKRYIYKADVARRIGEGVGLPLCWHPSIHMPREAARIFLRVTDVRAERLQDMSIENALSEGVPDEWPMSPVYCPHCKGEGLVGTNNPTTLGYMDVDCPYCKNAVTRFSNLWNSTIKPADRPTYGWEANPWAWVIEFERCEKPNGWPV